MKRLVIGVLAHVDSGKTTLSEALLFRSGALRKLGRVDHRDAFLDTDTLERARGITIFSSTLIIFWRSLRIKLIRIFQCFHMRSLFCIVHGTLHLFPESAK